MPDNTIASDCEEVVYSNDYADYIITNVISSLEELEEFYNIECIQKIADMYYTVYVPSNGQEERLIGDFGYFKYSALPKCYGLLDTSSMESIGVMRLRRQPYLDLLGKGVIVGIVDTGIDYNHPIFKNADNTTRILGMWNQTDRSGTPPGYFTYGTEYTRDMINAALQEIEAGNESTINMQDETGHGTFMAGIAAGNIDEQNDFTGAAPLADIAVVKLKEAKQYLRDYYMIKDGVPCFQENDIMAGISYLVELARKTRKPVAICIGLGTNSGDHDGTSTLDEYINTISDARGSAISIAAGNEANQGHHYLGKVERGSEYEEVEIKVGKEEKGFVLELWATAPYVFSLGFISPSGEFVGKITARLGQSETIKFLLEPTVIHLDYDLVESRTGDFLALVRLQSPSEGIWRIRVYDEIGIAGEYNMWLPMREFISQDTFFVRPEPDITICGPASAQQPIATATYNHVNNSIYTDSSRGYTRIGRVKPDITAPGVNVYGPEPGGGFGTRTGSSIAAAHTAGAAALLLEWALLEQNDVSLNGTGLKKLLIKGARRDTKPYPNREWGYGILDIYNVFESLRRTI